MSTYLWFFYALLTSDVPPPRDHLDVMGFLLLADVNERIARRAVTGLKPTVGLKMRFREHIYAPLKKGSSPSSNLALFRLPSPLAAAAAAARFS